MLPMGIEGKSMGTAPKGKDRSLSNLKAVMLLGIAAAHSVSCFRYVHTEQIISVKWYGVSMYFLTSCLGAFFFLSGYFCRMPEGKGGYRGMLKKKLKAIAVPYLLWNVAYIAVFIAGGYFSPAVKNWGKELELDSAWGIINTLLGITHHPADGPLWYLRNLFLLTVLYPVIRYVGRKAGWWCPVAIFALLMWLCEYFKLPVYVKNYYLMPYSTTAFCLGIVFREKIIEVSFFQKNILWWIFPGIAAIAGYCIMKAFGRLSIVSWSSYHNIICMMALPAWIVIAKYLNFPEGGRFEKYCANPAFFIYAAHFFCYSVFIHLLAPYVPDNRWQLLILLAIYFIGGISLMTAGYLLLKKSVPWLFRLLTGNR